MLPEENRLRKKKDIDRVYRKGRRYKGPLFLLITLARKDEKLPSRYAIVISKRTAPSAVRRNRGKRVLRGCIRIFLHRGISGYDTIVVVAPKFFEVKTEEVKLSLEKALIHAKLITKQ